MFSTDAYFGIMKADCEESSMLTVDALSLMDNQGVVAVFLDLQNINTEGETFE